uniref:GATA transcription factor n=1 Tax=Kalanchoe fedtschenkoi TaxID=63787 RepID=A0A7N0ZRJ1_KALFE
MEYCIEARALKPSMRREIDVRPNQSLAVDEFVYETEAHGGGFVEDFLIDDLLDFPEKEVVEEEKDSLSGCSAELETDENGNSTVTGEGDFLSQADDAAAGLAVPDDLADLEWVSRFVDDTMPEFPPLYNSRKDKSGVSGRKSSGVGSLPVQLKQPRQIEPLTIPAKPRTKRRRIGRVWSLNSSAASESSTASSSISSSSIISIPLQFGFRKPLAKKQKTNSEPVQPGDSTGRRCSHCQVQKTPQWRAGPEGAKTLCNACGVRFKSGRLYPEYRPACSPTFRSDVHSNSHRKVLEMRKKKEVGTGGSGLAVQSC